MPKEEIVSLEKILNGTYEGKIDQGLGDPCVRKFMEFRVREYDGEDLSIHPKEYETGGKVMIPIEPLTEEEIRYSKRRHFDFVNKNGTEDEWAIETDAGEDFQIDPRRLSARPDTNALELWTIKNGSDAWAHNVHIHYTEGKIIMRNGTVPPIWEQYARKDVYRVGGKLDSSESMVVALKFHDSPGDSYMMHCHNTQHEDHAMLLRYDIADKNCTKQLPCPLPTWRGVKFMETKTLPTFRTGVTKGNVLHRHPAEMLRTLRHLDRSVPNKQAGLYFVNGLGKPPRAGKDKDHDETIEVNEPQ